MDEILIELEDVTIHRRTARGAMVSNPNGAIVSNINLEVRAGELVYLIGKVGSGKSSLLKTLYAELPLQSGWARIGDFDLTELKRNKVHLLRRSLGLVFQDFQLLHDRSVYENMKFFLKAIGWKDESAISRRINETLSIIGLKSKLKAMIYQLSGGEQQRLAIGRALLNRPQIILADEPTGNLDPVTSSEIMELFVEIASMGCCVMLATHDISLIEQYPSRVLLFGDGKVKEIDM